MAIVSKKLGDIIKELIKAAPTLADDDNRLISNVHYTQLKQKGKDPENMTAKDYLYLLSKGVFFSTESIRRTRQKLQEQYPSLRGKKYKKRHKYSGKVRKTIKHVKL